MRFASLSLSTVNPIIAGAQLQLKSPTLWLQCNDSIHSKAQENQFSDPRGT